MTAFSLHSQAESLAAGLPALLLRAKRLAASINAGMHGRRRPGSGDQFWQFRHSQPGDALTAIDWRQSGKSDHLYVRESEWAIARTTRLWVDPSASLRWRSDPKWDSKYDRACLLAVAVGFLLEQAGERIGLLGQAGPAFFGRTAPNRLALALVGAEPHSAWPEPIPQRRGMVVAMSDFLQPLSEIADQLQRWSRAGLTGHLLQILDPAEEALPYDGRVKLRGLEQEGEILLPQAAALKEPYRLAIAAQRCGVAALANRSGWRFSVHHTDQSARHALTHLYAALARG